MKYMAKVISVGSEEGENHVTLALKSVEDLRNLAKSLYLDVIVTTVEPLTGRQKAARAKIRGMVVPSILIEPLERVAAGNEFESGAKWDVLLNELSILQLITERQGIARGYSKWALLDAGQAALDREAGEYEEES